MSIITQKGKEAKLLKVCLAAKTNDHSSGNLFNKSLTCNYLFAPNINNDHNKMRPNCMPDTSYVFSHVKLTTIL